MKVLLGLLLAVTAQAVYLPELDSSRDHQDFLMQATGGDIFYMRLNELVEVRKAQGNVEMTVASGNPGFQVHLLGNSAGMTAVSKGDKMYFHNVSKDDVIEWENGGGRLTLTWK